MKSILNKVLVVLAASALFAGSVQAAGPRKQKGTMATRRSKQRNAAKVEMSKLDFFQLVEQYGDSTFGRWSRADRIAALEEQYGSVDKAPKNLKMFLLGSDKDETVNFRKKYKDAALKELAGKTTKEATDNLQDANKDLEADPENPEKQAAVQEQTGILASMTDTMNKYLSPGMVTAAKGAIGTAIVAGVAYGTSFAVDYAAEKMGYGARPGAATRGYIYSGAESVGKYAKEKAMYWLPSAISGRIFAAEQKTDAKAKEVEKQTQKTAAEEQKLANKEEELKKAAENEAKVKEQAGLTAPAPEVQ